MPQRPDPPATKSTGSLSRRRLLVGGTFAATTAFVAGRLDDPNRFFGVTGDQASGSSTGPSSPARPTEPAAIGDATAPGPDHVYDLVVRGGRVIDPDTGYDRVADVGIDGDTITAISTSVLQGTATIEAGGLVVAPGFIDVLSYEPNPFGIWYKVADGVTTNLGMHGMQTSATDFFSFYGSDAHRPPCHYGGAFDSASARTQLGIGTTEATAAQVEQLRAALADGAAEGWLGVDFQPEYTPWVSTEEIIAVAQVAADHGLPAFFHARYSAPDDPGQDNAAALDEILTVARETGVAVHVDHITSTGGTHTMDESLATLEAARSEGLDVTACMYPYSFWATFLGSTRFAPGWQERFRLDYEDLVVPGTGERLTAATFEQHRADNTLVAAMGSIPEADLRAAITTPWIMVGSDSILRDGANNHPRAAGAFSRVLGRYVREQGVISLEDALAKMTILPARRLEGRCPALRTKGRMQIGADADITVFDPSTVGDRSTVRDPAQESTGIEWVLVAGEQVKTPDGVQRETRPGRPVRAEV